jgi:anti-sigma factor RsiW
MIDPEKDRVTRELLAEKLPRPKAPPSLRARIASQTSRSLPASRRRVWVPIVSALAGAAVMLLALQLRGPSASTLADEAVNDHLRVVTSSHPVEIESGGIHQVKPWFTGKLDFAPRVAFSGDPEFPLIGGSLGRFRDRPAAVFVWKRRLHTITLLVFRAEGLALAGDRRIGRLAVKESVVRGFSVLLFRDGDLGYALTSDVQMGELEQLALRAVGD